MIKNRTYRIIEPVGNIWNEYFKKYIGRKVFITQEIINESKLSGKLVIKIDRIEFYEDELELVDDDELNNIYLKNIFNNI
jgi:hypothetical protein